MPTEGRHSCSFFTLAASIGIWAYGASELAEKRDVIQPGSGGKYFRLDNTIEIEHRSSSFSGKNCSMLYC